MERKNKITAVAKETGLARTTPWNFGWFEDMDRWFDNVRRTFEDRFWGGPLARWTGSDAPVREPLVDRIDKGSAYVVRAEVAGVSKEVVDLTVAQGGLGGPTAREVALAGDAGGELKAERRAAGDERRPRGFDGVGEPLWRALQGTGFVQRCRQPSMRQGSRDKDMQRLRRGCMSAAT